MHGGMSLSIGIKRCCPTLFSRFKIIPFRILPEWKHQEIKLSVGIRIYITWGPTILPSSFRWQMKPDFHPFVAALTQVLDYLQSGKVYFVVDGVSEIKPGIFVRPYPTKIPGLSQSGLPKIKMLWCLHPRLPWSVSTPRFYHQKWMPDYRMTACHSHVLRVLNEGNGAPSEQILWTEVRSGKIHSKEFISPVSVLFYPTSCLVQGWKTMTSGFQGFHKSVVEDLLSPLLSKAHFLPNESVIFSEKDTSKYQFITVRLPLAFPENHSQLPFCAFALFYSTPLFQAKSL